MRSRLGERQTARAALASINSKSPFPIGQRTPDDAEKWKYHIRPQLTSEGVQPLRIIQGHPALSTVARPSLRSRPARRFHRTERSTLAVITAQTNMALTSSNSSDGELDDYTATDVLLGYTSKKPAEDPFNQLGGQPVSTMLFDQK